MVAVYGRTERGGILIMVRKWLIELIKDAIAYHHHVILCSYDEVKVSLNKLSAEIAELKEENNRLKSENEQLKRASQQTDVKNIVSEWLGGV